MMSALTKSIANLGNKLDDHKKDAVPLSAELDDLVPYRDQARTSFDEEGLQELAESFRQIGLLEPLLVRPQGSGKYEIIAGERRWRAARIAGLRRVPVLARAMDDATADKVHLAENIHRENLSTLDLAQRVQRDLEVAGGDLAVVATKYNKGKPWVSKLSTIAQGGSAMTELVDEGVTADRAVLATVASLERKAPEKAKALGEQLKAAPANANKRGIAERFMKEQRAPAEPAPPPVADAATAELAWRGAAMVERDTRQVPLIAVELSPLSGFAAEFKRLSKKFGSPRLALTVRHPDATYAIVQFGDAAAQQRAYRADELRLVSVG